MPRLASLLILACWAAMPASAQFPFALGGSSLDQGFDVAVTPWSGVVVVGEFRGEVDFDPGPGSHVLTASGQRSAFVAQYTETGALDWAFALGAEGVDQAHGVTVDAAGNVYVIGTFRHTVDFDPGPDAYPVTSHGLSDAFLASYTAGGALRWAFALGGADYDQGHAVALAPQDAVCATGSFRETVDFDPGSGTAPYTSAGSYSIWTACYGRDDGALRWAYGTGGPGHFDRGWAIAADSAGVYLTGDFTGEAQFDPAGEAAPLTSLGPNDLFVAAYTHAGAYRWARRAGSTSNEVGDRGNGIAVAPSGVYVTGDFTGAASFGDGTVLQSAGGRDAFLARYAHDGSLVWAFGIGGPGDERGNGLAANGDRIALTAYFDGTVNLNPRGAPFPVTSNGGRDFFLATYAPDGLLADGFHVGGDGNDQANGLDVTAGGTAFLTGSFRQTVDFTPGQPGGVLTAGSALDAFVATYTLPAPPVSAEAAAPLASGLRLALDGPNPFAGATALRVVSPAGGAVRVAVYDVLGREVSVLWDGPLAPGEARRVALDGAVLAPGVYVVRATAAAGEGAAALRVSRVR